MNAASTTPGREMHPLGDELRRIIETWATSQYQLVTTSAEFADSGEWCLAGAPTAAHWLAGCADVEVCTAREWIRIGRKLKHLPATADAFATGSISYSKVRTLTRVATAQNESELLPLAVAHSAADLGRALAAWQQRSLTAEELAEYHYKQRSVKWRTAPDGMVHFRLRLPPLVAGLLITFLTTWIMRTRPKPTADAWPSTAQQHADAVGALLTEGAGAINTELVLHVRGDGCTLDDGTPVADNTVAKLVPTSLVRALIYDSEQDPIDATNRRRHPTTRQKRLVKARDQHCVDCGSTELLQYDHNPPHHETGHTITDELELRCGPCHWRRHSKGA